MGNIVNATISLAIELTDYSVPVMESALVTSVYAIPVGRVMPVIARLRILHVCLLVSQGIKMRIHIYILILLSGSKQHFSQFLNSDLDRRW